MTASEIWSMAPRHCSAVSARAAASIRQAIGRPQRGRDGDFSQVTQALACLPALTSDKRSHRVAKSIAVMMPAATPFSV